MGDSVGEIGLDLVVNQKQFNKQMSGITNLAKKTGVALAAAFAVKKLVQFGVECVKLGSDLEEVQNVVDVTFPKMSKQVDDFAKSAIASFGLSETMAKRFTGTFGAMAKAFGFSESEAYRMSTSLTGLAGDIASFYNISQDEAYTKLKSVFTGETESLKDLGVVMTQTALDAYAMANGFGKTTKSMSEAEKVALRYAFVQKQLSAATSDFIRTSDSWANQVRVLKLQFDSLKATLGQGLINILTPVVKAVNVLIGKLITLANAFKSFTEAVTGKKSNKNISSGMGQIEDSSAHIGDNLDSANSSAKKLSKTLMSFDKMNVLQESKKDEENTGGSGSTDLPSMDTGTGNEVSETVNKWSEAFEKFKNQIKPTTDALSRLWNEGLSKLGSFSWTLLKDFYNEFLVPIGNWAFGSEGQGFPRLIDICNDLLNKINWSELNKSLKEFFIAIEPYAEQFGEGLIDFFEDIGNFAVDVINAFPGLLNKITDALNKGDPARARDWGYAFGQIAIGLVAIKLAIKGFTIAKGIYEFFKKVCEFGNWIAGTTFIAKLGSLGSGIVEFGTKFGNFLGSINPGMIGEIGLTIDRMCVGTIFDTSTWVGLPKIINDAINDCIDMIGEGFLQLIQDFASSFSWDGTAELFEGAKEFFNKALKAFEENDWGELGKNILLGIINGFLGAVSFILEPIHNFFTKVWENICSVFGIHSPADTMMPLGENILLGIVEGFASKIDEFSATIQNWFDTSVAPWFTTERWIELWEVVKLAIETKIEEIHNSLSEKWTAIKDGISDVVISIKDKISDVFTEIWTIIKGVINSILGGIESMTNGVINGINAMTSALSKLQIDLPEWVPLIGGKTLGFSIPAIPNVSIPKLANGGYVKANTPQLAMIGDNRHQGEVVAPEGKLRDMVNEAVDKARSGLSRDDIESIVNNAVSRIVSALAQVGFNVDGEQLATLQRMAQMNIDTRFNSVEIG